LRSGSKANTRRTKMENIINIIKSQLSLARNRDATDNEIGMWLRDLTNRLGSLSPGRLEAAFTSAREDAAERRSRGRFGQLSLDDVILSYRRAKAEPEDLPQDPYCAFDCDGGHVLMVDRDNYDVTVPCSCQTGTHLRNARAIYRGKHNVDELLQRGWKLRPRAPRIGEEDLIFLMARSFETSIAGAMWEMKHDRRIEPRDESRDRAVLLIGKSIGQG
jgi:hypothetical protein